MGAELMEVKELLTKTLGGNIAWPMQMIVLLCLITVTVCHFFITN